MDTKPLTPWQDYTQLYQLQLTTVNNNNSASQLYVLSQQLVVARLALAEQPVTVLQHKLRLTPALARVEILYSWCLHYQWPSAITSLLLCSSFCSSLNAELLPTANNALPKHPALACAKYNSHTLPSDVLIILSHCYANQRRLAYTQQQPLSSLLTLAEQLTPALTLEITFAHLRQQMALYIMYSRCELELSLLGILANKLQQNSPLPPSINKTLGFTTQADVTSLLLGSESLVANLPVDDYTQLEHYIQQHPVMATHIMQRASQLNRQRQNINNVKLAISLLGINALPLLLASAELQQQLTDLQLPNHVLLQQFTQCFAAALSLVMPTELAEDKANLLAYCLCAPLWLNQNNYLHSLISIKPAAAQLNLPLNKLITDAGYLADVSVLLNRYQLSAWQSPATELLHYLNRQPTKLTYLSLSLLTAWQGAISTLSNTKLTALQQLLVKLEPLGTAGFNAEALCQHIATISHCYCPLQLDL